MSGTSRPPESPTRASPRPSAPPAPSWQAARALAYAAAPLLPARTVPLAAALGRPLVTDLTAPVDLPHYASSAMDGWAVAGAGPWRLQTTTAPSHGVTAPLIAGDAVPILTGGAVPEGATAVLRSEHGRVEPVAARDDADPPETPGATLIDVGPVPVPPDAHIRLSGEEALAGDVLIRAGEMLTPAHLALAAVAGADTLTVRPTPAVTALLTGDEVITAGIPAPGQVRDAFGPVLPGVLELLGGRATAVHRLPDDRAAVTTALAGAAADVVVTTGGTGRSTADHVRAGLLDLGAELIIDGIDVRPGHPAVLARLPDGPLVVALPGNPLAAMLTLLTLAEPVLAGLLGRPRPGSVLARSTVDLPPGRTTRLVPARREAGTDGVVPCGHTGAGMLRGLAEADVVLVVPARGLIAWREAEAVALPWQRRHVDGELPGAAPETWGSDGTAAAVERIEGPRI
ncbi:molybdopterin molybdenumtransferase MoeA [Tersicoccus solisilvae]|uniref:Molybdopterin molybdenumtransferase n=1 Tax=Tersicoccus solisilvae TaxID=1882339 RepID=A0ABQ1NJ25_9MICC|nr:molybdopterin molybdotransferase MoeA [Tersicoccus solisilvae]GGC78443.1 molybdopterin molybdenumtransferase MoeA [Tersicoccus solisilvae]